MHTSGTWMHVAYKFLHFFYDICICPSISFKSGMMTNIVHKKCWLRDEHIMQCWKLLMANNSGRFWVTPGRTLDVHRHPDFLGLHRSKTNVVSEIQATYTSNMCFHSSNMKKRGYDEKQDLKEQGKKKMQCAERAWRREGHIRPEKKNKTNLISLKGNI